MSDSDMCKCGHASERHYVDGGRGAPLSMTCLASGCECRKFELAVDDEANPALVDAGRTCATEANQIAKDRCFHCYLCDRKMVKMADEDGRCWLQTDRTQVCSNHGPVVYPGDQDCGVGMEVALSLFFCPDCLSDKWSFKGQEQVAQGKRLADAVVAFAWGKPVKDTELGRVHDMAQDVLTSFREAADKVRP